MQGGSSQKLTATAFCAGARRGILGAWAHCQRAPGSGQDLDGAGSGRARLQGRAASSWIRGDDVMKYRHVVIRQFGGPEVLQVAEDDLPAPHSGQALVKVLAADVGFSDVNIRRGRYPRGPRPPFTPGYAMVGVVNQLGPGTAGLETGQRVAAGKTATITVGYGTCQITVEPS